MADQRGRRMPKGVPFEPGSERAKKAGQKGGKSTAYNRRSKVSAFTGDLFTIADWAGMRGPTWEPWRALLRTSFGFPHSGQDLVFYREHTGRDTAPVSAVSECWVVAGRRGGKSRVSALVGLTKALQFDAHARLAPGELAVVPILAADRKQARVVLGYLRGLCELPDVRPYVHRVLKESVELRTGVNIEVLTASFRTIRGYTIPAAVLDELAFWNEEGANPDSEILDALRPGMSTVSDALLFAISSPYARRGELYATYDRYYGQDNRHVVVWCADTRTLNPNVASHVIERAFEEDPIAAASEYGQDGRVVFRTDVEAFLPPEAVAAVTVQDRRELPPMTGTRYVGFVDPSGGSQDSFTLAIAHRDNDRAILDAVRERRPPFSPDAVVEEYAALLHQYGITTVSGDRYAGEWPREAFKQHGIRYEPSERTKSDIYREFVAPTNAGRIELLDLPVLRAQLVGLERRVARGGKDSIDHAPGGRDDVSNAAVGALIMALPAAKKGAYYAVASFGGEKMGRQRIGGEQVPSHASSAPTTDRERRQRRETEQNRQMLGGIAAFKALLDARDERDYQRDQRYENQPMTPGSATWHVHKPRGKD